MIDKAKAATATTNEVDFELEISSDSETVEGRRQISDAELKSIAEALIFVAEEPIGAESIADLIDVETNAVEKAISKLVREYDSRNGGLQLREIAGGWQIATRPEHHENVRAYLRSKPSAKLSLASLETLAVIAYKQTMEVR